MNVMINVKYGCAAQSNSTQPRMAAREAVRVPVVIPKRCETSGCHAREDGHPVCSGACDGRIKIDPIWIFLFDQTDLPCAIPSLQPLLTQNRLLNVFILLVIDEAHDVVPF